MRPIIYGDTSTLRSAVFYNRTKLGDKKVPVKLSINILGNSNELNQFMEYNFKFKVDKGELNNFNIHNMMGDYLNNILMTNDVVEGLSFDINSQLMDRDIVFQLDNNSEITREYDYFKTESFSDENDPTKKYQELVLDIDPNVQTIEFYNDLISSLDGFKAYDEETYDETVDLMPAMIINFGPEISYEAEDYLHPETDLPSKPDDWSNEDKDRYQVELDEYSNKKFLYFTITSNGNVTNINLSINAHTTGADSYHGSPGESSDGVYRYDIIKDPHRFQKESILRNDEMKRIMMDKHLTESYSSNNTNLVFDKRSDTLLGSIVDDKNSYIILNDYLERIKSNSNGYEEYSYYVEYNFGDIVYYLDREFKSVVDGNIGQNPFISPLWTDLRSPDITPGIPDEGSGSTGGGGTDPDEPPTPTTSWFVTINSSSIGGSTYPSGRYRVNDGGSLTIKLTPNEGYYVSQILVNGEDHEIPSDEYLTIDNITNNITVNVVFSKENNNLVLAVTPEDGGSITGAESGEIPADSIITLTAVPNERYEFDSWLVNGSSYSFDEVLTYTMNMDTEITAKFSVKQYTISTKCSQGGYIDPEGFSTVDYGGKFTLYISPYAGYIVRYYEIDGIKTEVNDDLQKIELNDIISNHDINVVFGRPIEVDTDEDFGVIKYSTIGDLDWQIENLSDKVYGSEYEGTNGEYGSLYLGSDLPKIQELLSKNSTGFRLPAKDDWNNLFRELSGTSVAGAALKSTRLYVSGEDKYGWATSNNLGTGEYKFNALPGGNYEKNGDIITFSGVNQYAYFWSNNIEESTQASEYIKLSYNSDSVSNGFSKIDMRGMSIRLCRETNSVEILGSRYVVKKYGNLEWVTSNLDYPSLGEYYLGTDKDSINRYGTLHDFDEMLSINSLLSRDSSGFRVANDEDWKDLEYYLGMDNQYDLDNTGNNRGTTEGARLKKDDKKYSGFLWNGYATSSEENTMFRAVPGGYKDYYSNEFSGIGSMAKFWSAIDMVSDSNNNAMIRLLKNTSTHSIRQTESKSNKCSIRLVRNIK